MSQVVIGMDPHKRTATIEVMAGDEAVVGRGRYATDAARVCGDAGGGQAVAAADVGD
jgi:hypothetical protein